MRELYRMSFERKGHEVFTATNGVEAYYLFLDTRPDVILSDIHMPDMNGIDLALVLRHQGYRTPIILVSGGCTYIHGHLDDIVILRKPASEVMLTRLIDVLTL